MEKEIKNSDKFSNQYALRLIEMIDDYWKQYNNPFVHLLIDLLYVPNNV